ncbi:hypothetical protein HDV00_005179 [Rhizophlyctis rosea]|nr:hypothetical protein HDV00_005179 [Rhizophlyctis rosea]
MDHKQFPPTPLHTRTTRPYYTPHHQNHPQPLLPPYAPQATPYLVFTHTPRLRHHPYVPTLQTHTSTPMALPYRDQDLDTSHLTHAELSGAEGLCLLQRAGTYFTPGRPIQPILRSASRLRTAEDVYGPRRSGGDVFEMGLMGRGDAQGVRRAGGDVYEPRRVGGSVGDVDDSKLVLGRNDGSVDPVDDESNLSDGDGSQDFDERSSSESRSISTGSASPSGSGSYYTASRSCSRSRSHSRSPSSGRRAGSENLLSRSESESQSYAFDEGDGGTRLHHRPAFPPPPFAHPHLQYNNQPRGVDRRWRRSRSQSYESRDIRPVPVNVGRGGNRGPSINAAEILASMMTPSQREIFIPPRPSYPHHQLKLRPYPFAYEAPPPFDVNDQIPYTASRGGMNPFGGDISTTSDYTKPNRNKIPLLEPQISPYAPSTPLRSATYPKPTPLHPPLSNSLLPSYSPNSYPVDVNPAYAMEPDPYRLQAAWSAHATSNRLPAIKDRRKVWRGGEERVGVGVGRDPVLAFEANTYTPSPSPLRISTTLPNDYDDDAGRYDVDYISPTLLTRPEAGQLEGLEPYRGVFRGVLDGSVEGEGDGESDGGDVSRSVSVSPERRGRVNSMEEEEEERWIPDSRRGEDEWEDEVAEYERDRHRQLLHPPSTSSSLTPPWNASRKKRKNRVEEEEEGEGEGETETATVRSCANCHTTKSPSWRICSDTGRTLCNACGLYRKTHGRDRPFTVVDGAVKVKRSRKQSQSQSQSRNSRKSKSTSSSSHPLALPPRKIAPRPTNESRSTSPVNATESPEVREGGMVGRKSGVVGGAAEREGEEREEREERVESREGSEDGEERSLRGLVKVEDGGRNRSVRKRGRE